MPIELDHTIVPTRNKLASAALLAELLGVPWAPTGPGPFAPVYVNAGLTLDFIDTDEDFPVYHFCFRVSEAEFDAILARLQARGIAYRSAVRGPGRLAGEYRPRRPHALLERARRPPVGDAHGELRAATRLGPQPIQRASR